MKTKLPLLLLTLMVTIGCKKNDSSTPSTGKKIYLLSRIISTQGGGLNDTASFTYDDKNRLIEFYYYSYDKIKIKYDDSNNIIEVDLNFTKKPNTVSTQTFYTYNLPIITASYIYNGQVPTISKEIITVNDKQLVTEAKTDFYDTYYTYDDKNNITTYKFYNVGIKNPIQNYSHSYDFNKNPMSQVVGNLFLIFPEDSFVNNIVHSDYDLGNGSHEYIDNSYEYNIDGFPTKKTETINAGNGNNWIPTVSLYTYIVK